MEKQTIIEETQEICTLCGGHGRETLYYEPMTTAGHPTATCRACRGIGHIVTQRVVRTIVDGEDGNV